MFLSFAIPIPVSDIEISIIPSNSLEIIVIDPFSVNLRALFIKFNKICLIL